LQFHWWLLAEEREQRRARDEKGRKCGKTVTFIMKLGKVELRQADARSISVREWPTHKNKVL